ncbi:MAG TPA: MmgE/PrpD family protein [Burkholderiales bacterium]|jgi:2-methylcitrate dehydratase PrpD|nr:MmgE/PrpD family protein [Burkholderiales bacterium]
MPKTRAVISEPAMSAESPQISPIMAALSGYIASALRRNVPEAVTEQAKHLILDTMGAMISGTRLAPGRKAVAYVAALGGSKEALVVGTALITSAFNAALANGMLAHADETDDSHAPSHTHPGCSVVPAALAMAERGRSGGTAMLRAVVLGYDVCCRLTMALDAPRSWHAGLSTHGFGGTFGAAAAAGALARLNARQVRHLLSYAAQQASGVSCLVRDSEHIEKAFDLGGLPAQNGVRAATMVAQGFTGVDDVLSGERNFLSTYSINPNPDELIRELGSRFEIMHTNVKKWSVGSPIQAALDSLLALLTEHRLIARDVEKVVVRVDPRGAGIVNDRPMPAINLQHMLAVMLHDGTLGFASAHDEARMQDPRVRALKQRIELVATPELTQARPRRQAIVEITTRDGRTLSHRTYAVRGTADNPMTRSEVEEKFRDLAAPVVGARRAAAVIAAVSDIESIVDMRKLRPLLTKRGN